MSALVSVVAASCKRGLGACGMIGTPLKRAIWSTLDLCAAYVYAAQFFQILLKLRGSTPKPYRYATEP